MIINTAGEYTLQYTATDACGNTTTVERELTVEEPPTYRTVLYTDGTFIINESSRDEADNIALHGAATNVYDPFDPNGDTTVKKYIFTSETQRPWNSQASSVRSVEIGSNIQPTSTASWFYGMTDCTSIDLAKLDTSAVTNMKDMFNNCQALTSLDVSNFNTSAVTNMKSMFNFCQALTALYLSNFNTSAVTDMSAMFNFCQALTSLDVSNFNTSAVTDMSSMFYGCQALTSLDVSNFNTSAVTNMNNIFRSCQALTSLDVSSFNTGAVTDMGNMFSYCQALNTIYASVNFVVTQVTNSNSMFGNMSTNLVGGAGTTWASSSSVPKDKTYARIDNPPSDPGFFTARP